MNISVLRKGQKVYYMQTGWLIPITNPEDPAEHLNSSETSISSPQESHS